MDRRVFISYANEDQALADHICAALEAAGVDCWMASRNIGPGPVSYTHLDVYKRQP